MSGFEEQRQVAESKEAAQVCSEVSPFDDLASAYDAWFDDEGKLPFDIEVGALREVLPFLPRPWLEIGVGSGRFAQALGIESGIDPSIRLVEMARRRGVAVFLGKGEQEPFQDESFGTVFLIVTLCFVDSPMRVLTEARRILVPGGKAVLGLVPRDSPWGRFYGEKRREGHRFYRYATFHRYSDAIKLLGQAGFTVERVISTLFQEPGGVVDVESPQSGYYPGAGFTVLVAERQ